MEKEQIAVMDHRAILESSAKILGFSSHSKHSNIDEEGNLSEDRSDSKKIASHHEQATSQKGSTSSSSFESMPLSLASSRVASEIRTGTDINEGPPVEQSGGYIENGNKHKEPSTGSTSLLSRLGSLSSSEVLLGFEVGTRQLCR